MSLDSDLVIIGTGVAPLVAAQHLSLRGKSVLVLNPERDFFIENSELDLDPLWPVASVVQDVERLKRNPRFELRTVVSSLLFHVSVGFGYTPETLRNLTISLAPFQRATSHRPARRSASSRIKITLEIARREQHDWACFALRGTGPAWR